MVTRCLLDQDSIRWKLSLSWICFLWVLIMQERFIRAYLESALALQHCTGFVASERTEGAMEEAAAQLLRAANAYIPMSHLIWGLWGLLQV